MYEMGTGFSTHKGEKGCIQGFNGKSEGRKTQIRSKRRWKDNIRMDHRETGRVGMDWIHLA
jgi:hypothetical protein